MFIYGIFIEGLIACFIFMSILISTYHSILKKRDLFIKNVQQFKPPFVTFYIIGPLLMYFFIHVFIINMDLNYEFINQFIVMFIVASILSVIAMYIAYGAMKRIKLKESEPNS
jgi:membrane protein CcdC involved in cytochrome C biogenesis